MNIQSIKSRFGCNEIQPSIDPHSILGSIVFKHSPELRRRFLIANNTVFAKTFFVELISAVIVDSEDWEAALAEVFLYCPTSIAQPEILARVVHAKGLTHPINEFAFDREPVRVIPAFSLIKSGPRLTMQVQGTDYNWLNRGGLLIHLEHPRSRWANFVVDSVDDSSITITCARLDQLTHENSYMMPPCIMLIRA